MNAFALQKRFLLFISAGFGQADQPLGIDNFGWLYFFYVPNLCETGSPMSLGLDSSQYQLIPQSIGGLNNFAVREVYRNFFS